jgi:hypothetical protein
MRFIAGVILGILVCGVFPELPRATQALVNDLAHTAAEATEPSLPETVGEALTDWRNQ